MKRPNPDAFQTRGHRQDQNSAFWARYSRGRWARQAWLHLMGGVTWLLCLWLCSAWSASENSRGFRRAEALRAVAERLGVGPGSVVADIGCGNGPDSRTFAAIVGSQGTVLAEEIDAEKLESLIQRSEEETWIVPILGQSEDPRLPNGQADLAFMHRVFHHFSRPRAMLRNLWFDLKPGGYLVIVDQREGPLTDWTPMEEREKQHHWTGETAVVRLAREEGFQFFDLLDDQWHEKDPFVLVFRRPMNGTKPGGDPDPAQPIKATVFLGALPGADIEEGRLLFFGLNGGRSLLAPLRERMKQSVDICDVVMEEWALTKEETPSDSDGAGIEILRTGKGELQELGDRDFKVVLFADAYHRVWDPTSLLIQLRDRVPRDGRLVVLDRKGPKDEPRRVAGHRRRISPGLVRQEMEKAGFEFQREIDPPAPDRFVLVFQ